MTISIGLDTGGTYTDAVLYDRSTGGILAVAKAPTTHYRLSEGLTEALGRLLAKAPDMPPERVDMVCLSTTLATNAVAEGAGGRVGLVLIGYDPDLAEARELIGLPKTKVRFIGGGHDFYGQEEAPLDEEALLRAFEEMAPEVEAWAVSSFFAVKNPAHELAAKEILEQRTSLPITLGHLLTGRLGSTRRAATAALNAGLTPLIRSLIDALQAALAERGLSRARLMVVKGDGSLASEEWARERPLETVVSGPAASVVGARMLVPSQTNRQMPNRFWVMDVGGTTTDLAYLKDGYPKSNKDGAYVGGWWTMVEAAETRTRGLGGDSLVEMGPGGELKLGPRRVWPLCRLAEDYPQVLEVLKHQQYRTHQRRHLVGRFFIKGRPPGPVVSELYRDLKDLISDGPCSFEEYADHCRKKRERFFYGLSQIDDPALMVSAFTPTDAMAILGLIDFGRAEAAELGARLIAAKLGISAQEFARRVLDEFGRQMSEELLAQALINDGLEEPRITENPLIKGIFDKALGRAGEGQLKCLFKLREAVVVMGAPAAIFGPLLKGLVTDEVIIPPRYEVAGAVGAASSKIALTRQVNLTQLADMSTFRAFLPGGIKDYRSLEGAITGIDQEMRKYMAELARLAGARNPHISHTKEYYGRTEVYGSQTLLWGSVLNMVFRAEEDQSI